jgi:hypothetical protein
MTASRSIGVAGEAGAALLVPEVVAAEPGAVAALAAAPGLDVVLWALHSSCATSPHIATPNTMAVLKLFFIGV